MSLQETLLEDLKQAMLSKDSVAVSVLRMLKAEIMNAQIQKGAGSTLDDEEILKVIKKEYKKRLDSAQMYQNAGEKVRADAEISESVLLEKYLPAQMSDDTLFDLADQTIKELGKDANRGELIKNLISKVQGQADGKRVADAIARAINS